MKLKKRILVIAGLHGTPEPVVSFLEKVLKGDDPRALQALIEIIKRKHP